MFGKNGWGIFNGKFPTLSGEKRTIFNVYFAYRHLEARRFPGQIEISYHNQFGSFQWALYFKTGYPFISLFIMKYPKESPEVMPYSKKTIPELDLDKEYERQYWEDVDRGLFDNKCETCERLQDCDDDICP